MDAVGGPQTYVLGGAFNCGKGSTGAGRRGVATAARPPVFRGVNILNTVQGGGR